MFDLLGHLKMRGRHPFSLKHTERGLPSVLLETINGYIRAELGTKNGQVGIQGVQRSGHLEHPPSMDW